MLAEVEKGNIGTIIVKDMSRLGRNYVQMEMLREQLRRANVRLIAVNEGVDTGSGFEDSCGGHCLSCDSQQGKLHFPYGAKGAPTL